MLDIAAQFDSSEQESAVKGMFSQQRWSEENLRPDCTQKNLRDCGEIGTVLFCFLHGFHRGLTTFQWG